MLNLNSYIHRRQLEDIMSRWLLDRYRSDDCPRLKDITNFNSYLISRYLDDVCMRLFEYVAGEKITRFEVGHKARFKDFIVRNPPYQTPRIEELLAHYGRYPQDYYRHAPFHGVVYHTATAERPRYLGHSRIKRTRRIAEKGARRIIDHIFNMIKAQADILAGERSSRLGIPKSMLITDPQTQLSEFVHAERRVIKTIRKGTLSDGLDDGPALTINDVAGLKVILEDDLAHRLYDFVDESPDIKIVEIERHEGNYNATNLILKLSLDHERLLASPPEGRVLEIFARRGMGNGDIAQRYTSFVSNGDPDVHLEVILSNYGEMLESELGRCMHEERILTQRRQQEYRSPLAHNVRYLIEYMFLFTVSPTRTIDKIPIKLWESYMPDSFDEAVKSLWDIEVLPAL
ncbi:MAG: hypothetical protein JRG91_17385 [Deltaproteobacteria bacterium]|nr:hypothetical protein [Deltaproteobacteria bacterium]